MNEAALKQRLVKMVELVNSSPAVGTDCPQCNISKLSLDDIIDQLQMQTKYVLFDLEATRRENRYLRQMVTTKRKGSSDS